MLSRPGALLGLVGLLRHRACLSVNDWTQISERGRQTHERLASASLASCCARHGSLAQRILAAGPVVGQTRSTTPPGARRCESALPPPNRRCYTGPTPAAGRLFSTDSRPPGWYPDPVRRCARIWWRRLVDGSEAGLARRSR
jgi:hypothetical protein